MFAKLKRLGLLFPLALVMAADDSQCNGESKSDKNQRVQQESLSQEATAQTGMPAIKNFRERKLLKDILELRDQDGLATYTHAVQQSAEDHVSRLLALWNDFTIGAERPILSASRRRNVGDVRRSREQGRHQARLR